MEVARFSNGLTPHPAQLALRINARLYPVPSWRDSSADKTMEHQCYDAAYTPRQYLVCSTLNSPRDTIS